MKLQRTDKGVKNRIDEGVKKQRTEKGVKIQELSYLVSVFLYGKHKKQAEC